MTRSPSLSRRGLFLTLTALMSFSLATSAAAQSDRAERKAAQVDRLAEALDLSAAQKQILTDAEPGDSWAVAAALTPTLSDAQKAALFTRPDRGNRVQRDGRRGGKRNARTPREDRGQRPERSGEARAERHEAMAAALNLTSDQTDKLKALRAAHKAEHETRHDDGKGRMRDRAPGEIPAELAAILTPAQQDVFKVHRALMMRMKHGRRHTGQGANR